MTKTKCDLSQDRKVSSTSDTQFIEYIILIKAKRKPTAWLSYESQKKKVYDKTQRLVHNKGTKQISNGMELLSIKGHTENTADTILKGQMLSL